MLALLKHFPRSAAVTTPPHPPPPHLPPSIPPLPPLPLSSYPSPPLPSPDSTVRSNMSRRRRAGKQNGIIESRRIPFEQSSSSVTPLQLCFFVSFFCHDIGPGHVDSIPLGSCIPDGDFIEEVHTPILRCHVNTLAFGSPEPACKAAGDCGGRGCPVPGRILILYGNWTTPPSTVKRRKLKWHGHVTRSSGLAKTILQGTVQGGRRRGRQRKRWEDNIKEWTSLPWNITLRKAQNREEWRKLVVKSTVVPQTVSQTTG